MLDIQGKYNIAKVFTDNIDNAAYSQILMFVLCQTCMPEKVAQLERQ